MALKPGTQVGPYEITAPLGAGGMGEVFRATDTKLKREVAIKALPDELVGDADRLARFEREAVVLASLNHPHIASIYGLEDSGGVPCLVLELVDGQTLDERIASGAVAPERALEIAQQIALALEAAHEKGVVHRDLKPANVKLTPEGAVKVLDFGLAKALAEEPPDSAEDTSHSPTRTMSATQEGVVLGTAAYMSPEQARGKAVDKRTDVWAFGCVLYELLSGRQVFAGETASDSLARILEREPDWTALPAETPARIRRLLQRCLRKKPHDRLHDVADARIAIEEVLADPGAAEAAAADRRPRRPAWARALPWALVAVTAVALVALLVGGYLETDPGESPPPTHLSVILPQDLQLFAERPTVLAISPDGRRLALVVDDGGVRRLYVRSLDEPEGTTLAGTENANSPFFSPDGRWIGFKVDDEEKLKKVSVEGGAPVVIVDDVWGRGAVWGEDDRVIFPKDYTGGLWRVPATGGDAEPLTEPDVQAGESADWWPQILEDGRTLLFTACGSDPGRGRIVLQSLETGRRHVLIENAAFGRYLPTGHLLYLQRGILFAVRFDLAARETIGNPVPVIDDPGRLDVYLAAHLDISAGGTLAYLAQSELYPPSYLTWIDREGSEERLDAEPGPYANPRVSADGRTLAVSATQDLWLIDLAGERANRLTHGPLADEGPVWVGGSRQLVHARGGNTFDLYRRPADGGADAALLHSSDYDLIPSDVTSNGEWLLFFETHPVTGNDLWYLSLTAPVEPTPFVRTPFLESTAAFSPDGRWVAYQSNESGRTEIYVRDFPAAAHKVRVSIDGGESPHWSPDGKEVYFLDGHRVMATAVKKDGEELTFGAPTALFETRFDRYWLGLDYDVAPDGRFLMIKVAPESSPRRVNVVLNWFDEVERLLPND